jgi:hypothetical protein
VGYDFHTRWRCSMSCCDLPVIHCYSSSFLWIPAIPTQFSSFFQNQNPSVVAWLLLITKYKYFVAIRSVFVGFQRFARHSNDECLANLKLFSKLKSVIHRGGSKSFCFCFSERSLSSESLGSTGTHYSAITVPAKPFPFFKSCILFS